MSILDWTTLRKFVLIPLSFIDGSVFVSVCMWKFFFGMRYRCSACMSVLWSLKNAFDFSFSSIFSLKNRRHLMSPIQYHTLYFTSGWGNWKFLILLLLATQNLPQVHKTTKVLLKVSLVYLVVHWSICSFLVDVLILYGPHLLLWLVKS